MLVAIEEQSVDIAQGLHYEEALEKLGAGDQGEAFVEILVTIPTYEEKVSCSVTLPTRPLSSFL